MPPVPLTRSLAELPLVLAGPMVRAVTLDAVTVFVALRDARKVTLRVYAGANTVAQGTRTTVSLGDHLHVVAVTAPALPAAPLRPGTLLEYDLAFGAAAGPDSAAVSDGSTLFDDHIVSPNAAAAKAALTYQGGPSRPSFPTPPADPARLRVIHASCRKPHGEGADVLAAVDLMIEATPKDPLQRPQLLLLTGDQIYADDVADVLLAAITPLANLLLGYEESVPTPAGSKGVGTLPPGTRQSLVDWAGLTTAEGRSHLLSFGEFCVMYLLAWCRGAWPSGLPLASQLSGGELPERAIVRQRRAVYDFWRALPGVRRMLANVPSLMMLDDHEVTDDWNLTRAWMKRVLDPAGSETALGRRVVRNALAAYAVFQDWGSRPDRYADGGGVALLDALSTWRGAAAAPVLDQRVGLPAGFTADGVQMPDGAITWHYAHTTPSYQVLMLDTRTQRGSPGDDDDPASLLGSQQVVEQQVLSVPLPADDVPVLVVVPAPLFGHPIKERVEQQADRGILGIRFMAWADAESWSLQPAARERLLSALASRGSPGPDGVKRRRVVVLGGDVHYGLSASLEYRARTTPDGAAGECTAAFASLVASACKNEDAKTRALHCFGYVPLSDALPVDTVVGFANPGGDAVPAGHYAGSTDAWMLRGAPAFGVVPSGVLPVATWGWRYTLRFLLAATEALASGRGTPVTAVASAAGDRTAQLNAYLLVARGHDDYLDRHGSGKEVVGRNNVGELTFRWDAADAKAVVHDLWWALPAATRPFPLSRYEISLANGSVATAATAFRVRDAAGNERPLADAWLYVRDAAGAMTTLRTDVAGAPFERDGGAHDEPWTYTKAYAAAAAGGSLDLTYSRGARPVPATVLAAHPQAFETVAVPAGSAVIVVGDAPIELTAPAELSLWPLLREFPPDSYATAGLPAAWAGFDPLQEQPAPAPPANARAAARGLRIAGRVGGAATGVHVALHGPGGPLNVRAVAGTAAPVATEIAATLAPAVAGTREFEAEVFLADAAPPFGPLQVVVRPAGMQVARVDAFTVQLCGAQLALVADLAPLQRGPVVTEADERVILDFDASPQPAAVPANSLLTAQARARRMAVYEIGVGRRPLAGGVEPVPRPQMPLFMGELQLVGVPTAQLRDLMRRLHHRLRGAAGGVPVSLRIDFSWRMELRWDGPDVNSAAPAIAPGLQHPNIAFAHAFTVDGTVGAELRFGSDGGIVDAAGAALALAADGSVPNPWTAAVAAVAFPMAGRRAPTVFVEQRRERWGREAGAPQYDAVVVEFQPEIADAGREVIRGGDGTLTVGDLRFGGRVVDMGVSASPPAAGDPHVRLPTFRVRGRGPTPPPAGGAQYLPSPVPPGALFNVAQAAEMERLIELLVEEEYARNVATPAYAPFTLLLPLAVWQETARLIFRHESGNRYRHFDANRSGRWEYQRNAASPVLYYGKEHAMPLFGPPHGYGIGQLDNYGHPPAGATADEVWSFEDNLRRSVRIVLGEKAGAAHNAIGAMLANPPSRRDQAMYRREVVRGYNGGTEFRNVAGVLALQPSWRWSSAVNPAGGPNQRLLYPNHVLGTGIVYWQGQPVNAGAATVFGWDPAAPLVADRSIPFGNAANPNAAHAHYGPGF